MILRHAKVWESVTGHLLGAWQHSRLVFIHMLTHVILKTTSCCVLSSFCRWGTWSTKVAQNIKWQTWDLNPGYLALESLFVLYLYHFNHVNCTIQCCKYIHIAMQPLSPSTSRTSLSSQTETLYPWSNNFPSPTTSILWVATVLFSVCVNLHILDTTCNWDHRVFVLLCPVYFTLYIFKVRPCCNMCQNFLRGNDILYLV